MDANNPEKANAEYKTDNGASGGGRRQVMHHGFQTDSSLFSLIILCKCFLSCPTSFYLLNSNNSKGFFVFYFIWPCLDFISVMSI